MQFTIPCPLSQGQSAPSEAVYLRPFPYPALHLHTRALVGTLPELGAFLWGCMVNMRASVDTFLTTYSSRITASPEQPIFVRSPRSTIWLGATIWVMT